MRINEFLSSKGKLSIDDFKSLQLDYFSHYARELTPYIIRAFENIDVKESLVKEGLDYLKRWNYNFSRDDIATTIF